MLLPRRRNSEQFVLQPAPLGFIRRGALAVHP